MTEIMNIDQLNDLRARILAWRRNEGPKPSTEELQQAYASIREHRTSANPSPKSKAPAAKATTLPIDLKSLFK